MCGFIAQLVEHRTGLSSVQFSSVSARGAVFYFILFYFILFYFILFYSVLFCFLFFCFILFYFICSEILVSFHCSPWHVKLRFSVYFNCTDALIFKMSSKEQFRNHSQIMSPIFINLPSLQSSFCFSSWPLEKNIGIKFVLSCLFMTFYCIS